MTAKTLIFSHNADITFHTPALISTIVIKRKCFCSATPMGTDYHD